MRDAIKVLNATMKPNRLVPLQLVVGYNPGFRMNKNSTTSQRARLNIIKMARDEVLEMKTAKRMKTSQKSNVPPPARHIIKKWDEFWHIVNRRRSKSLT